MKYCKKCGSDSFIYDSRYKHDSVVRRRKCKKCGRIWMTVEVDYWEWLKKKEGDDHAELL